MRSERPTTAGSPIVQFSVMIENRVGSLSRLVNLVRECHVEVLGLSLMDSVDVTVARLVVTDPDAVLQQFLERGIPHSVSDVVVVELPEGAASLGDCLSALLEAETNIHFSYALLMRLHEHPLLALYLDDAEFGIEVLRKHGFTTLCQEDLSR